MIAVIIGSTGLTGSFLVKDLLHDSEITKVISVSRKSVGIQDSKLNEIIIHDLTELKSIADKLQGDIYFCCLGTTIKVAGTKENFLKVDHDAVIDFAKVAKNHSAKSLTVISAMGAKKNSIFFYNKVKGQTEEDLRKLNLHRLVIFQPSLLVGPRTEFRFIEVLFTKIQTELSPYMPASLRKRLVTVVETLAQKMLSEGKKTDSGIYVVKAAEIS